MFDSKWLWLVELVSIQLFCLLTPASAQTMGINETSNANGPQYLIRQPGELLPDGKVMRWNTGLVVMDGDGYFVPVGHHRHWGGLAPKYEQISGQRVGLRGTHL